MTINTQPVYTPDPYFPQRKQMVEKQLLGRGIRDERVLRAMLQVPRHDFVAKTEKAHAYEDCPLPIRCGQTISQPYIVATIADLAELSGKEKVLEIGAGCGYQAAVLSLLAREVWAMEYHRDLSKFAQRKMRQRNFDNVHVVHGDGKKGLAERAPFDRIIVSCAALEVAPAWKDQLADSGILIFPMIVGRDQILCRWIKGKSEWVSKESVCSVRFVPLL